MRREPNLLACISLPLAAFFNRKLQKDSLPLFHEGEASKQHRIGITPSICVQNNFEARKINNFITHISLF